MFSSEIDKEERDIWKLLSEITQWNVQYMVHENNMKIKLCRCRNKLPYGTAYSYTFLRYFIINILYRKKQHIFFSLTFYKHKYYLFLPLIHVARILTFVREELCVKFSFVSFCFVKQTNSLSLLLSSVHVCDKILPKLE